MRKRVIKRIIIVFAVIAVGWFIFTFLLVDIFSNWQWTKINKERYDEWNSQYGKTAEELAKLASEKKWKLVVANADCIAKIDLGENTYERLYESKNWVDYWEAKCKKFEKEFEVEFSLFDMHQEEDKPFKGYYSTKSLLVSLSGLFMIFWAIILVYLFIILTSTSGL